MLIIGKNGRLASTFASMQGNQLNFLGHQDVDLSRPDQLEKALDRAKLAHVSGARVLVNTAAFTNVDLAESKKEEAQLINAVAPGILAKWAHENNYSFIQYSTDYVYPGCGEAPWLESKAGAPVNHYGSTKLEGDQSVAKACARHLIFRTTWLYGEGENFPRTLLRMAADRAVIQVVNDQIAGPTHMDELVRCSLFAINECISASATSPIWGVYNLVNSGFVSKFHFAQRCLELAYERKIIKRLPELEPVASTFFNTPAKRPLNSRLSTEKFKSTFKITPKPWDQSLEEWFQSENLKR